MPHPARKQWLWGGRAVSSLGPQGDAVRFWGLRALTGSPDPGSSVVSEGGSVGDHAANYLSSFRTHDSSE